jgi:hypothetical protein
VSIVKTGRNFIGCLMIGLMVCAGTAKPSSAQTGSVSVTFSKASFVAGIAGGSGVLTFHGKRYPFKVSGAGLGATVGVSTNVLKGYANNLHRPQDFAGAYTAFGAGGAVAAGVSAVRLQNANRVMLVLRGAKLGVELSANLAYVTITMQ